MSTETLSPDAVAEIAHAEALHFEDAYDAARDAAEIELLALAHALHLDGADDGCLLPGRGYRFFVRGPRAALHLDVTPAGAGRFTTAVVARYTHTVSTLDDGDEAGNHYVSEAAAVAAAEAATRCGRTLRAVWRIGDDWQPAVLVFDGLAYRP
jgi:hypothetical protein